eukprot:4310709-Amphidinium_carterae.1
MSKSSCYSCIGRLHGATPPRPNTKLFLQHALELVFTPSKAVRKTSTSPPNKLDNNSNTYQFNSIINTIMIGDKSKFQML